MDPLHFTIVAERLVTKCRDKQPLFQVEADLRTAIGRCYYAAFIKCRTFLQSLGYKITERGACHGVVMNALTYSKSTELREVASDLGSLGTERRWADYQLTRQVSDSDLLLKAEACLEWAKSVCVEVDKAAKLVKSDAALRARIIKAINEWVDGLPSHQKSDITKP